jgi:hypothetical protein
MYPSSTQDSIQRVLGNIENIASDDSPSDRIAEALKTVDTSEFTYNDFDVIRYNLGIGATEKDLQWIFEGHDEFQALPTFGVIPQFPASFGLSLDFLPNFNPVHYFSWVLVSLANELRSRPSYFTASSTSRSRVRSLQAPRSSAKPGLFKYSTRARLLLSLLV